MDFSAFAAPLHHAAQSLALQQQQQQQQQQHASCAPAQAPLAAALGKVRRRSSLDLSALRPGLQLLFPPSAQAQPSLRGPPGAAPARARRRSSIDPGAYASGTASPGHAHIHAARAQAGLVKPALEAQAGLPHAHSSPSHMCGSVPARPRLSSAPSELPQVPRSLPTRGSLDMSMLGSLASAAMQQASQPQQPQQQQQQRRRRQQRVSGSSASSPFSASASQQLPLVGGDGSERGDLGVPSPLQASVQRQHANSNGRCASAG